MIQVFVFFFLISLSMIISRSSMLLQMALFHSFYEWVVFHCTYICTTSTSFIHLNGHLGCFHVLIIVNSVAMIIEVYVSFQIIILSEYMPRSGILLDHMRTLLLVCWGNSMLFSIVPAPIYILTNSVEEFPFLHTLSASVICRL